MWGLGVMLYTMLVGRYLQFLTLCHNTRHNRSQPNDTAVVLNVVALIFLTLCHNTLPNDIQHSNKNATLSIMTLETVMLSVVNKPLMLNVTAPIFLLEPQHST